MQRWPLRVILGALLAALVVVGYEVSHTNHSAIAATTTTSVTTPHTGTTSAAATTTTVPVAHPPRVEAPITATGFFKAPGRGCHLATDSSSPTSTVAPHLSPLGHCVVLEVGDSLGNDLGWGLNRELGTTPGLHLLQMDVSSTGLITPWFYNWPQHLAHYLHVYHPHLVIMMFGANDEQGIVVNGHAAAFGTTEWHHAYAARLLALAKEATKTGAYVLWVGLPIMQQTQYREGAQILNALYASVVTKVPGVTFQPVWKLFASPSGHFRTGALVNNVPEVLRASDGIHLSYFGEDVLATHVANQISSIYHVVLRPREPTNITR